MLGISLLHSIHVWKLLINFSSLGMNFVLYQTSRLRWLEDISLNQLKTKKKICYRFTISLIQKNLLFFSFFLSFSFISIFMSHIRYLHNHKKNHGKLGTWYFLPHKNHITHTVFFLFFIVVVIVLIGCVHFVMNFSSSK